MTTNTLPMPAPIHGLYAITHEQLMPGPQLADKTRAILDGGCRWLQYRNKSTDSGLRLREAQTLQQLCERYDAQLIINDDIALAVAVGAAGVHLGQTDAPLWRAREQLGPEAIIGATCHASLELAVLAHQQGANYVAFGRFFTSQTKPQAPPAPLELIPQVKQRLALPTVAIGGINRHNVAQLITQGVDAVAISHTLFVEDDLSAISAQAAFFQSLFNRDHTS